MYYTKFHVVNCEFQISMTSIAAESLGSSQISSFRALRTLRAFRPLRAISRWQGMRVSLLNWIFPLSLWSIVWSIGPLSPGQSQVPINPYTHKKRMHSIRKHPTTSLLISFLITDAMQIHSYSTDDNNIWSNSLSWISPNHNHRALTITAHNHNSQLSSSLIIIYIISVNTP